ncbi:MAG: UDP-N-acetylmuramoyl-L-alanyl-D-glutamate--2,6-diaminopimelate ligase [Bacteroidales bacterium]|nr:UDP-N-acetylmuramoyl-L-alanyl-D-glutamate--2,6-diaminopimelate ligase [Bacteroidales bacterium]MDD4210421.1 UDP-N-acetylmuramoyl-L-alanyl-D-glutamate--2,6-diaminopimelate ligase [Bacteroidales bacterium]
MKKCEELVSDLNIKNTIGTLSRNVTSLCFDSRQVVQQSMYIAQKGTQVDGHSFIPMAIEKGACCIILEDMPKEIKKDITYIQVDNSSFALGHIASAFYDYPSKKLKLIGITGTNGKTTTVTLLHTLLTNLGYKVGLLSTIENKIKDKIIPSSHTTPDAIRINELLSKMCDNGCEYCFMEVSSHAIVQDRIAGLSFVGAIFSNLTHDHLDYHKTFQEYLKAKKQFFDHLSPKAFALSNMDDANGKVMLQNTKASKYYYSLLNGTADFKANIIDYNFNGMQLHMDGKEVWVKLSGTFNAYNLLVIYATAKLLGMDTMETLYKISALNPAEGRFSTYQGKNNIVAIVDYAHTPDALQNVLKTIKKIKSLKQHIITVIGCGGNRDKNKRPVMAKIGYDFSDTLILTSDNPRNENPEEILQDMLKGIANENNDKVFVNVDREQAIKLSISIAKPDDIILIAGKGHEKYQEIQGIKHHFDDVEIAKKYLLIT